MIRNTQRIKSLSSTAGPSSLAWTSYQIALRTDRDGNISDPLLGTNLRRNR